MSSEHPELFEHETAESSGPVECFGMTFDSEDARRAHFLERLKEKLPELRKRPDFPAAEDEDILRLSDPPYYTACPNPFIAEFVERHGRPYDPTVPYHREPFAVDVSEGKTDQLYKAHGYHTKVPHLAIVPSILHYTKPGDIVLDGFCGSGMTGVAAQWCGTAPLEYRRTVEQRWEEHERDKPEWGARRVILGDLSPAATFIAGNYNLPFDVDAFASAAKRLLKEVEDEIGWMYETLHTDGKTKGRINYTVWSEVFSCPECAGEVVFVEEALDEETKRVKKEFPCPHCDTRLTPNHRQPLFVSRYDPATRRTIKERKRVPVLINYNVGKSRYEKKPDDADLGLLRRIEEQGCSREIPCDRMMHAPEDVECWGDKWRAGTASFTHVHHLFLPRAAQALAALWCRANSHEDGRIRNILLFFVEQAITGMSVMNRYSPSHFSQVNRALSGVYYMPPQMSECSPWYNLTGRLNRFPKAFHPSPSVRGSVALSTGDCSLLPIGRDSIDYVFTDPPFGGAVTLGELNFVHEAFLRAFTN